MALRQDIVRRFIVLAAIVEKFSTEVADAIRQTADSTKVPHTWIVRWNYKGFEWEGNSTTPERIVGRAWVLAACGEWQKELPMIIPEVGRFQKIWVNQVEPLNKRDLEDAKRARELGLDVNVQPKYATPPVAQVTTREEFEAVVRTARPIWEDDSVRGYVVTGQEPGYDYEGRPMDVPVFGKDLEHGPGFAITGMSKEWVDAYSRLTAYTKDGATKFEAHLSNGGGGPVHISDVPEDAEWRIPRQFVEQLLGLIDEASQLRKEEVEAQRRAQKEAERNRLAAKFNLRG